ncbi:hypothetical protein OUZ56_003876 [Daphnia magna]|uniref:Uncharacterized protein n=1 Tax=Daphnia magna TaxID=35525 RepID=A0ABQ9YN26_9CRUS|nr:hypothetical protein OUZ56_003876 [Daphnia magna]
MCPLRPHDPSIPSLVLALRLPAYMMRQHYREKERKGADRMIAAVLCAAHTSEACNADARLVACVSAVDRASDTQPAARISPSIYTLAEDGPVLELNSQESSCNNPIERDDCGHQAKIHWRLLFDRSLPIGDAVDWTRSAGERIVSYDPNRTSAQQRLFCGLEVRCASTMDDDDHLDPPASLLQI